MKQKLFFWENQYNRQTLIQINQMRQTKNITKIKNEKGKHNAKQQGIRKL